MQPINFPITRQGDQATYSAITRSFKEAQLGAQTPSMTLAFGGNVSLEQLGDKPTTLVTSFHTSFAGNHHGHCHVTVSRNLSKTDFSPDRCELHIHPHSVNQETLPQFIRLATLLKLHLLELDPTAVARSNSDLEQSVFARREADIARLESLMARVAERFTVDMAEAQKAMEDRANMRETQLQDKLAKESDRLTLAIKERSEALDKRAQELEGEKARLDSRAATIARRAKQREIHDRISNAATFGPVPHHVLERRRPVAMSAMMVTCTAGILLVIDAITNGAPSNAFHWIRFSTLSIAIIAPIVFLVSWHRSLFEKYATHEYDGRKLRLDFDRAGWISELAMEWTEVTKQPMPPHLLRQMSAHLFELPTSSQERHTSPSLHDILGEASKTHIKAPWGDIEFDRAGAKRAAKKRRQ